MLQVLQVSAPWIKCALYCDDIYVIPGQVAASSKPWHSHNIYLDLTACLQTYVTVGGTRQYNDWMVS